MNISINFLPQSRKDEIKNLKHIGVVMRVGIMAILALCLLVFFLKAIAFSIKIEKDFIEGELLRFEKSAGYLETKKAQDSLREYSKTAKVIKVGLRDKKDYTELISKINSMIPEGIILNKLSLDSKELVLSGVALKRENLLFLEQKLKEDAQFKKIDSPISNLVSDTNAAFTFKVELE